MNVEQHTNVIHALMSVPVFGQAQGPKNRELMWTWTANNQNQHLSVRIPIQIKLTLTAANLSNCGHSDAGQSVVTQ